MNVVKFPEISPQNSQEICIGDIVKKAGTKGLFLVTPRDACKDRLNNNNITVRDRSTKQWWYFNLMSLNGTDDWYDYVTVNELTYIATLDGYQ